MKNSIYKLFALIIAVGLISLNSCKKDNEPDTQSAQDDARGAYISAETFAAANNGADGGKNFNGTCAIYESLETTDGLKFKLTFDNCNDDGHVKNGSIIVQINKTSWVKGASMTITFDNFSVDDDAVSGTLKSSFSILGLLQMTYNVEAKNMKVTSKGDTFEWSSVKTYKLDGASFTINGTGSGINRAGVAYTTKYTNILFNFGCEWPVSGTVEIKTAGSDEPTIVDYDEDGNADCDTSIKVTKNGNSLTVTL